MKYDVSNFSVHFYCLKVCKKSQLLLLLLLLLLMTQLFHPTGVDNLADITPTGSHCHSTSLPLIDLGASSRWRLYACHQHMQNRVVSLSSSISKCKLFPSDALYFRNGLWRPFPRKYGAFVVSLQLDKTTNKPFIYFKVSLKTKVMAVMV